MPPLPPSSVDTALSATSEVDGVTVTVISSPVLAAVTLPSSAATVMIAAPLPRSVVARERSARCRNDHKPSAPLRFSVLLFSADDSSCRKRDNIKPTGLRHQRVGGSARILSGCYRRDAESPRPRRSLILPQDFRATTLTIVFPRNGNSYKPHKNRSPILPANSFALAVETLLALRERVCLSPLSSSTQKCF